MPVLSDTVSCREIRHIDRAHLQSGFDCGAPLTNAFLHNTPAADPDWMVFTACNGNRILGFYSISATTILFREQPATQPADVPSGPLRAALIGHLAVDRSCKRRGIGARLLVDALQRISRTGLESEFAVVVVQAHCNQLRSFYLHYGFLPISGDDCRLFLPMNRITRMFRDSAVCH